MSKYPVRDILGVIKYPEHEPNQFQRTVGVIHGWNEITTNRVPGTYPWGEHDFTLPDLLLLLRRLKSVFDPERLAEIERLITGHITDTNNPHKDTLENIGTSVLQELYKLWLSKGHVGDEAQFLKEIFQYVRIADLNTTLEGKARDQVVSVFGLAKYVDRHDKDPNAHEELFKRIMPGGPLHMEPSFAAYGYCGFPEFISIKRDSDMTYITSGGGLDIAPPDTMPCDFTFGIGTFPIFGRCSGLISNNADMSQLGGKLQLDNLTATYHTLDDNTFISAYPSSRYVKLKEVATNDPVEHSLTYTDDTVTLKEDTYYTYSVFVRNLRNDVSSNLIGVYLPGVFEDPYSFIHFDIVNGKTFTNDAVPDTDLMGGVTSMRNGWFRLWVIFKTSSETELSIKLVPLDILDGDSTYSGTGVYTFEAIYPQVTNTSQVTPPLISSDDNVPVLEPTFLELDLSKVYLGKFNKLEGTLVMTTTSPFGEVSDTISTLYDLHVDGTNTVITGRFPTSHKQRLFVEWYQSSGSSIGYKYINNSENSRFTTFVHSYSEFEEVLGCSTGEIQTITHTKSLNLKANRLGIGCNRYRSTNALLNGYISGLSYYPFKCTETQVESLIGDD